MIENNNTTVQATPDASVPVITTNTPVTTGTISLAPSEPTIKKIEGKTEFLIDGLALTSVKEKLKSFEEDIEDFKADFIKVAQHVEDHTKLMISISAIAKFLRWAFLPFLLLIFLSMIYGDKINFITIMQSAHDFWTKLWLT